MDLKTEGPVPRLGYTEEEEDEGRRSPEREDNDCSVLFIFKQRSPGKSSLKMNGTVWPQLNKHSFPRKSCLLLKTG